MFEEVHTNSKWHGSFNSFQKLGFNAFTTVVCMASYFKSDQKYLGSCFCNLYKLIWWMVEGKNRRIGWIGLDGSDWWDGLDGLDG